MHGLTVAEPMEHQNGRARPPMLQLPKPTPQRPSQLFPNLNIPQITAQAASSIESPAPRPRTPPIGAVVFKPEERSVDGSDGFKMLKTPPLICEQGPSAPSSPTSPGCRSPKRPSPLSVDALQRFNLLSPNYVPSMDSNKLSPLSPSYPTSDLGSSPRSSISISHSGLGPNWTAFREYKKCSSEFDNESVRDGFLTPGTALSPAPFSPFSDCLDPPETPYSSRSPALSPVPMRHSHFSFDQIRSRSSMSNRGPETQEQARLLLPQASLDLESRERSRSEGEMLKKEEDELMDLTTINHSTVSVPVSNSGGQYKKRLLHKYRQEQKMKASFNSTMSSTCDEGSTVAAQSSIDHEETDQSASQQVSRQPTIEEPPPSPTFNELFHSRDLTTERQRQVEEWIKQQAVALEVLKNTMVPMRQETNLLQVPNLGGQPPEQHLPRSLVKMFTTTDMSSNAPGPLKTATLWRRSRSESDVTQPQNDTSFICEHCGQGFSMHDRLAKHIASRHRDRSASMNDETSKTHKCTVCNKSFGRSDMLTRHMRLHTGLKPYSCQICGQVFSRSDHLSTHQRTHTGEKPYRCPHCNYAASRRDMITRHMRTHPGSTSPFTEIQVPLGQLSLNQPSTPEPPRSTTPPPLHHQHSLQSVLSTASNQLNPPSNPDTAMEQAARLFQAAATGNISPQVMLSTLGHSLDTQIPTLNLRRSTPNLFQSLEQTPNNAQAINAAISRLLSPHGTPLLSRQASIGGFGFNNDMNPPG
ncbi:unnamed protein product [Bursaphelenchus xylophilus]|uniref:(pine wood nematode) hypothetical protein n=1 Tax=Bursaphelenchus xylophilus TaxID=6326 RepID=A0A1I7RVR8_BURXY|nr:unnamed protein product [Bursaphelenchus xylophilus]CAG9082057.1 unnamed protein product [Bursaphelenchus xylophilus]